MNKLQKISRQFVPGNAVSGKISKLYFLKPRFGDKNQRWRQQQQNRKILQGQSNGNETMFSDSDRWFSRIFLTCYLLHN